MSSVLSDSYDTIDEIIKMAKTVIDFDFSIVDENLKRLIGTGKFETYQGLTIPSSTMTAHVVKTGKYLINHETRKHDLCENCEIQNICAGESTIIYPIKKDDRVIGAISVIAFEDDKKEELRKNENSLFNYMKSTADLIYNVAMQERERKQFESTLNTVDKGIIITNISGKIIYNNEIVNDLYKTEKHGFNYVKEIFPQYDFNRIIDTIHEEENNEINTNFVHCNKRYSLTIRKLDKDDKSDVLFIFEDQKIVHKNAENESVKNQLAELNHIIGTSESIVECKKIIISAAKCDSNVLIQGESGTGKELFARALHELSIRNKGPFVAINCSAIPENLIESELFGYAEGSFTGASKGGKIGKFEQANNGTLFLDEIGDMPLHLQSKILRAIEYGQIEKIGSTEAVHLNIRIVAATNKPLEEMISDKLFRKDLFYRLNVIQINIPSLRDRREDIIPLARHFKRKFNFKFSKGITGFSKDVEEILFLSEWSGNIRELENAMEYAVHVESTSVITKKSIPKNLLNIVIDSNTFLNSSELKKYEKNSINELLDIHGTTLEGKKKVAQILGISLSTLYRRVREERK